MATVIFSWSVLFGKREHGWSAGRKVAAMVSILALDSTYTIPLLIL
jgi:hypothetical protein